MERRSLGLSDRVGLLRPSLDAHTLGLGGVAELLRECGIYTTIAPQEICEAACAPQEPSCARLIGGWIRGERLSVLGFSYRLDPDDGAALYGRLIEALAGNGALDSAGGTVSLLLFAGLPKTCGLVEERFLGKVFTFRGGETSMECLSILGLPSHVLPPETVIGAAYDEARLAFGRDLVHKGEYESITPVDRSHSLCHGSRGDSVSARIADGAGRHFPPLIRAHVGPYLQDRKEAIALFLEWTRQLAAGGLLDILSIGTSQLSQSEFGRSWEGLPDGGGVPIATPEEFSAVWQAARPMLVRSYAGARNVEAMARMLESRLDNAWHAMSLWWFCRIDGRGPNTVLRNLEEHLAAMKFVASVDKPFEPNVPHHFAFRGGDDLTYVLSGLVAAKAAKSVGIRKLVLQIMLNTPRNTSGYADLAKARALLHLVRELEDGDFKVYLQPRSGLDYFSRDPQTAKAQLAAATALMDDIEAYDHSSPQIIHVVSYSEGFELANPAVVNESVRITRHALAEYRRLREDGLVPDMTSSAAVLERTSELIRDARFALRAIESAIEDPYSPRGLYEIMASGFFAIPDLMECRDEFAEAVKWKTRLVYGSVRTVDEAGKPISAEERIGISAERARSRRRVRDGGQS